MHTDIPHDELINMIRKTGEQIAHQKQVVHRLKELASTLRQQLTRELRTECRSAAHAERSAFLHAKYTSFLQETLEARSQLRRLRVECEMAQMLYNARKSRESWHKAFLF